MAASLDRVAIRGFKSIRELEDFELRNLNVFVGANGAGKSNLTKVVPSRGTTRRLPAQALCQISLSVTGFHTLTNADQSMPKIQLVFWVYRNINAMAAKQPKKIRSFLYLYDNQDIGTIHKK